MNPACQDLEVLLSLRAAGALDPAEAARVEAHLQGCAACRAEAAASEAALRLATLPPPSDAERSAVATLAKDALAELRRGEARAASWKRTTAAFVAAAAVAAFVLAPALLRKPVHPAATVPATALAQAQDGWEAPDLDTLWSDADVLDLSNASASASAYGYGYGYGYASSTYASSSYDATDTLAVDSDQ